MSLINIKSLFSLSLLTSICFSCSVYAKDTTINITSTPAMSLTTSSNNITMNVEPTSTGSFQTTPLIITAGTNNPNGYTLYFSVADNNTNLAGNNSNISTLDNNGTTGYTPSTFTMNRWGYSIGAIASPDNDTTIYHPAPTITSPTTIDTYVGAINSRATTINLATKVDFATAAGSYNKQLVVSMLPTISTYELIYNQNTTDTVANLPSPIIIEQQWSDAPTPFIIDTASIPTRAGYDFKGYTTTSGSTTAEYAYNATTGAFTPSTLTPSTTSSTLYAVWEKVVCVGYKKMQDIATIKSSLAEEAQTQLCDTRDEKVYWVAKLKDGNVWMTQNLDLGGSSAINLDSTNTNLAEGNTFTLPASGSWSQTYSAAKIYDPGDNYIPSGTGSATSATSLAADSEDLHYHQGNYYNWYAATAGSDASKMNKGNEAPQSICPKGWRLPHINQADKSWYKLVNNGVTNITASTITQSPVYIPRAGYYYGSANRVGSEGDYWSSTVYGENLGDGYYVYQISFISSIVDPRTYNDARGGHSVRCVAL